MKFERLTDDGRLWAVKYDDDENNIFDTVFAQWTDVQWLREFFNRSISDLSDYFHITDVDQAIFDTLEDADRMQCLILDLNPGINLDSVFRPLENYRASEVTLGREKAKGQGVNHPSWLRLYAIRLQSGRYIITGGAIKLTRTMLEREHTLRELSRMNTVRDFLIELGIYDYEGFESYTND